MLATTQQPFTQYMHLPFISLFPVLAPHPLREREPGNREEQRLILVTHIAQCYIQPCLLLYPIATVQLCPMLPDPDNGTVTVTSRTLNSEATYSCDVGYVLDGSATRTCEEAQESTDLVWSGSAPTCMSKCVVWCVVIKWR